MLGHPLLSRKEEAELARRIKMGDEEAVHELVRHNMRLAWVMAERWAGSPPDRGAEAKDLFSAAILGLYKAAWRFRAKRGSFARYAAFFIRDALRAEVRKSAIVSEPPVAADDRRATAAASWQWLERTGREAAAHELADMLGWTERSVNKAQPHSRPLSLDAPAKEGPTSLGELIGDDSILPPDERCAAADAVEELRLALGKLDKRSREVITRRFGIGRSTEGDPLRVIGEAVGLSGERIRQIEWTALAKLRAILTSDGRLGATAAPRIRTDVGGDGEETSLGLAENRRIDFAGVDSEVALCLTA